MWANTVINATLFIFKGKRLTEYWRLTELKCLFVQTLLFNWTFELICTHVYLTFRHSFDNISAAGMCYYVCVCVLCVAASCDVINKEMCTSFPLVI